MSTFEERAVVYAQQDLDARVRTLAEAIARGAGAPHIKVLERHVVEAGAALERSKTILSGGIPKGKRETFVRTDDAEWFVVDKILGSPSDGKAYFIGKGEGFDIFRVLAYASNGSDALEIAEEKCPKRIKGDSEIRILSRASEVSKGVSLGAGDARLLNGKNIRYT